MIDVESVKKKIIVFLQENGPSLPVKIAKAVGLEPVFASAILSEMSSIQKVKLSTMRVGSSRIYYLSGQEQKLEVYAEEFLGGLVKKAYLLVKEKKFLYDDEQEPAVRVALRSLKDFAIPFKYGEKIMWRYAFTPKEEILKLLESGSDKEIKKEEKKEEERESKKIIEGEIDRELKEEGLVISEKIINVKIEEKVENKKEKDDEVEEKNDEREESEGDKEGEKSDKKVEIRKEEKGDGKEEEVGEEGKNIRKIKERERIEREKKKENQNQKYKDNERKEEKKNLHQERLSFQSSFEKKEKKDKKEQTTERQEEKRPEKKEEENIKEKEEMTNEFSLEVIDFLKGRGLKVIQNISETKNECSVIIEVKSGLGILNYFVIAKNKKSINEADILAAMQKANEKKMPCYFLHKGKLTKKSNEVIEQYFGLIKVDEM